MSDRKPPQLPPGASSDGEKKQAEDWFAKLRDDICAAFEALEDALAEFGGCSIIISHDRWFLDRLATHILAFEGDSQVEWFQGNYADYEADRRRRLGDTAAIPKRPKFRRLASMG